MNTRFRNLLAVGLTMVLISGCGMGPVSSLNAAPSSSNAFNAHRASGSTYKVTKGLLFVALPDPDAPYNDVQVYDVRQHDPKPLAYITNGVEQPESVCINAAKRTLYVVNAVGFISEFQLGATSPFATITQGIDEPGFCAIDKDGNFWVTNVGGKNVSEYPYGSSAPSKVITNGLPYPVGIAFDHSGNLYVSNHGTAEQTNVQVFLRGHTVPSRTITDGVQWPVGIGVDAANTLYVTNLTPGNIEEYRYGRNKPYHKITQEMHGPCAVTYSAGGWMYVSNEGAQGGGSGPPYTVLEFPPRSQVPGKKMIAKDLYAQEGIAFYPPQQL